MASGAEFLIAEGKTKLIYAYDDAVLENQPTLVLIKSKDCLTAFNAVRSANVEGKAEIANQTAVNVFKYLNKLGCPTHFVASGKNNDEFIAQSCAMIPIEFVARRIATGSFLKRFPGVPAGMRFGTVKIETFYKDDANDDPQWSDEQIINAEFKPNKLQIGQRELTYMKHMTSFIFQALERAWAIASCQLVDMKIEFGVNSTGKIVLADVIDNDSWRIWPEGQKERQLDKQVFRDLPEVTAEALLDLKKNYSLVAELTRRFLPADSDRKQSRIVVIAGSGADRLDIDDIIKHAKRIGIPSIFAHVSSAHKSTAQTLEIIHQYEGTPTVIICIAGKSNGLGPVIASNCALPVINCPNNSPDWTPYDIWSSLRMPSGVGVVTVLGNSEAVLAAAKILGINDHIIGGSVMFHQAENLKRILDSDAALSDVQLPFNGTV